MRQSIILPDKYEAILFNEAEKAGLISNIPELDDAVKALCNPMELQEAKMLYKEMLNRMSSQKQKVFQMMLLFDEIILDKVVNNYNFNRLVDTGAIKIFDWDDFAAYDPIHMSDHIPYAKHIKPAILPVLQKDLKRLFPMFPPELSLSRFASDIYNYVLLDKKISAKYDNVIEINKALFDVRHLEHYKTLRRMNAPETMYGEKRFFTDIAFAVTTLYKSLCWQLMISSNYDSAIFNSEFQLHKIGGSSFVDADSSMQAYQLLRIECRDMIGTLPKVDSIKDVLKIRGTRHHDLHNLRQELSHLEETIRNGASEKALEKAGRDVNKASKALSVGGELCKINKWTNYLLLPVEIASLFASSVPLAIGGGVMKILGKSTSIIGDLIIRENKWFEIII